MNFLAQQIEAASSVAELAAAATRIDEQVAVLHSSGTGVENIAQQVSALNAALMARLWALLAPADVQAQSCLLVMGSEGRGEQILKTDQDNALLLCDGFNPAGLEALAQRFSAALAQLGYPPCPGHIMVTNPLWRQPLADFKETLRRWVVGSDVEGPMHLAVFFDAACIAGDAALLQQACRHLDRMLSGQDIYMARFAAAADQFHEPGNWFTRLASNITHQHNDLPLDLKKLGIFPIVHGVRALALQNGVRQASTVQRVAALQAQHKLGEPLAQELVQALHQLMDLRLHQQLQQRARGQQASNEVQVSALTPAQRSTLQQALAVVKRFRVFLRLHFQLDLL